MALIPLVACDADAQFTAFTAFGGHASHAVHAAPVIDGEDSGALILQPGDVARAATVELVFAKFDTLEQICKIFMQLNCNVFGQNL